MAGVTDLEMDTEQRKGIMIKNINIRFNLDKEEHRKAWDYMQTMDRSMEKTYSKVIIISFSALGQTRFIRASEKNFGVGYTKESIRERIEKHVKAQDQMLWVRRMNNIRARAEKMERICEKLDCDFADLVNHKRTQEEKSSARWSNSHFPSENKED